MKSNILGKAHTRTRAHARGAFGRATSTTTCVGQGLDVSHTRECENFFRPKTPDPLDYYYYSILLNTSNTTKNFFQTPLTCSTFRVILLFTQEEPPMPTILLPCPLCGGEPELYDEFERYGDKCFIFLVCCVQSMRRWHSDTSHPPGCY